MGNKTGAEANGQRGGGKGEEGRGRGEGDWGMGEGGRGNRGPEKVGVVKAMEGELHDGKGKLGGVGVGGTMEAVSVWKEEGSSIAEQDVACAHVAPNPYRVGAASRIRDAAPAL